MTTDYRNIGRQRVAMEKEVVASAVSTLIDLIVEHDIDREPYDKQAAQKISGLPKRYREEFQGMADIISVPIKDLQLYAFAIGDATDAIADNNPSTEGCTNVVVASEHTVDGQPLVLKNRDVSGAALRPQAAVTYPGIGDRHGFTTISTCGSVLVFQGVNDKGLVAANTFVDVDTDTDSEREILNGTLVRRILEECTTVSDARTFVSERPLDRIQGLTLVLADNTDTALLEIDPLAEEIRDVSGSIVARTNHFIETTDQSDATKSTTKRFVRANELIDGFSDNVSQTELFTIADDHDNGPGSNSICRHGDSSPYQVGCSTTVSTNIYRGGVPTCYGFIGNPCQSSSIETAIDEPIRDDLRTGQYWRRMINTPHRI